MKVNGKKWGGISLLFTLLLAIGLIVPTATQTAYAASITTVRYEASSLNPQRVYETVDGEEVESVVYCVNPRREYKSTNVPGAVDSDKRVKYVWNAPLDENAGGGSSNIASAMGWAIYVNRYDSDHTVRPTGGYGGYGANEFLPDDWWSDDLKNELVKVLFYGYPNDADKDGFTEEETQEAVYWVILAGKNGGDTSNTHYNELAKKAMKSDAPETWSLYVYTPTPEGANDIYSGNSQFVIGGEFSTQEVTEPKIENTTLTANGTKASADSAAKVTITEGEKVTLSDDVELSDLTKDEEYTVSWKVFDTSNKDTAVDEGTEKFTADSDTKTVTIKMKDLDKKGTYTVVTELLNKDGSSVDKHNSDFAVLSETVEVTVNPKEENKTEEPKNNEDNSVNSADDGNDSDNSGGKTEDESDTAGAGDGNDDGTTTATSKNKNNKGTTATKGASSRVVKTGDNTPYVVISLIAVMALALALNLGLNRRKAKNIN